MAALVRRFFIVTLVCLNFALLFVALLGSEQTRIRRSALDLSGRCAAATAFCGSVL